MQEKYKGICEATGLKTQYERMRGTGNGSRRNVENTLTSGYGIDIMLMDSGRHKKKITDESIAAIPTFDEFETPEINKAVNDVCTRLLTELKVKETDTEGTISIAISNGAASETNFGIGVVQPIQMQEPYIAVHNHPSGDTFSALDMHYVCFDDLCSAIVAISNDGTTTYSLIKTAKFDKDKSEILFTDLLSDNPKYRTKKELLRELQKYGLKYVKRSS